jgi:hypothetical protein
VLFPWSAETPGGPARAFVAVVTNAPIPIEGCPPGLEKAWTSATSNSHVWVHPALGATHPAGGGVVCSSGRWRIEGSTWPDVRDQDSALAAALSRLEVAELVARSRGVFSVLAADRAGNVEAFADPLGFASLFRASTAMGEIVASHAGLAAWGRSILTGQSPSPDVESLVWLTLGSQRLDFASGYSGVSQMEGGAMVRIASDGRAEVKMAWTPPWRGVARPPSDVPVSSQARWLVEEVAECVSAAIELSAPDPLAVDLTGGRDSRLILAAILEAGLQDRCEFHTAGPPQLADVQLAQFLADRYGLTHRRVLPQRQRLDAVGEIEQTVWLTEAMTSAIRPVPLEQTTRLVRVSGIFDGLRAKYSLANVSVARARAKIADVATINQLGLLDERLVAAHSERAAVSVLGVDPSDDADSLNDSLDAMWMRFGLRQHIGAMQPFVGLLRVLPLYSTSAIELAFRQGNAAARQRQEFHKAVCALVRGLDEIPFSEEFAATRTPTRSSSSAEPASLGRADVETLARVMRAEAADGTQLAFRKIAEQAPKYVWELVDKERFDLAASQASASPQHQRELFGAASAIAWLTGFDGPALMKNSATSRVLDSEVSDDSHPSQGDPHDDPA